MDSEEPASNVTVCIQMKEWNLTLHKKEYPLALCQIEGVALDLTLNPVEVRLQKLSLNFVNFGILFSEENTHS